MLQLHEHELHNINCYFQYRGHHCINTKTNASSYKNSIVTEHSTLSHSKSNSQTTICGTRASASSSLTLSYNPFLMPPALANLKDCSMPISWLTASTARTCCRLSSHNDRSSCSSVSKTYSVPFFAWGCEGRGRNKNGFIEYVIQPTSNYRET